MHLFIFALTLLGLYFEPHWHFRSTLQNRVETANSIYRDDPISETLLPEKTQLEIKLGPILQLRDSQIPELD